MKFCPECGNDVENMKFCSECGYKIGDALPGGSAAENPAADQPLHDNETIICQFETKLIIGNNFEKKLVGDINISRAKEKYTLTTERLIIEKKGVIRSQREEIEGYKIKDIQVNRGIIDKARKIGDITIISTDPTTPTHVLNNVENPQEIADQIRTMSRNSLRRMNIMHHENI